MGAVGAADLGEAPFEGSAVEEFAEDFGDDWAKGAEVGLVGVGIGINERDVVPLGTLPKRKTACVTSPVGFQAAGGSRIASLPSETSYEENRRVLPPVASRSFSLPASIGITTGARAPRKAPNRTFAGPIGWCFPLSQSRSVLGWTPRSLAHCSLVIFRSKRDRLISRLILCAGGKKATSPTGFVAFW